MKIKYTLEFNYQVPDNEQPTKEFLKSFKANVINLILEDFSGLNLKKPLYISIHGFIRNLESNFITGVSNMSLICSEKVPFGIVTNVGVNWRGNSKNQNVWSDESYSENIEFDLLRYPDKTTIEEKVKDFNEFLAFMILDEKRRKERKSYRFKCSVPMMLTNKILSFIIITNEPIETVEKFTKNILMKLSNKINHLPTFISCKHDADHSSITIEFSLEEKIDDFIHFLIQSFNNSDLKIEKIKIR
jgi:hypothetical protein